MNRYMVVATFKPGTNQEEVTAMAPEEGVAANKLAADGVLNSVRVSMPRDKVFLDITAEDAAAAEAAVNTLPMVVFWDLEIYQVAAPV